MSQISPPTFEEFAELARKGNVVPVVRSVMADLLTPVSAFMKIQSLSGNAFLLESVEGGEKIARYSFLGVKPHRIVRGRGAEVSIEEADGSSRVEHLPMLDVMRQLMKPHRPVAVPGLPPFVGGAVGYFGYDAVRWFEKLPQKAVDDLEVDTAVVMFFSSLLAFDHVKHQIQIIVNVFTDEVSDLKAGYKAACDEIAFLEKALEGALPELPVNEPGESEPVRSNMTREYYGKAIEKIKDYILAGDAFQIVFAQRFQKKIKAHPFKVYRALRAINPSPYMFYLKLKEEETLLGASPEMLVRCNNRNLEYRPIAGTFPRGRDEAEDNAFAEKLRNDEKEKAEHIMLVDLGRNDLGRVSEYSSVKVAELMIIEKYSHVMHLVSVLKSRLRQELDCFDALRVTFLAGTVSGAPKVRAMEIIDELEPTRRGVYAGAVVYFDYSGNLDSCIALRTMYVRDHTAYIQAGGGIVADSVQENEFQETVNKSRACVRAIEIAESDL